MEVLGKRAGSADIRVTADELLIIGNALNEICHGFDIAEFQTRIGASRTEAQLLLRSVGTLYRDLSQPPP